MTASFLIYVALGKIVIFIGQTFLRANTKSLFWNKLIECDMCLGVWIYTILAWAFKINIDVLPYVPLVSNLVIGCAVSFITHLLTLGWRAKFEIVVI